MLLEICSITAFILGRRHEKDLHDFKGGLLTYVSIFVECMSSENMRMSISIFNGRSTLKGKFKLTKKYFGVSLKQIISPAVCLFESRYNTVIPLLASLDHASP